MNAVNAVRMSAVNAIRMNAVCAILMKFFNAISYIEVHSGTAHGSLQVVGCAIPYAHLKGNVPLIRTQAAVC